MAGSGRSPFSLLQAIDTVADVRSTAAGPAGSSSRTKPAAYNAGIKSATTPDIARGAVLSPPLESPSSVSALSSSPSSMFRSLVGAAALTPLSSLDGGDIRSPPSTADVDDKDTNSKDGTGPKNGRGSPRLLGDTTTRPKGAGAESRVDTNCAAQLPLSAQATGGSASERRQHEDPSLPIDTKPERILLNRAQPGHLNTDASFTTRIGKNAGTSTAAALSNDNPAPQLAGRRFPDGTVSAVKPNATSRTSSLVAATTAFVRPRFASPVEPLRPAIIRTTSSHGTLPLRQPVPDPSARSGIFAGNIAQLEATAERLSMTSSIEDAIREAHRELKRSDSRRSSFLAASVRHTPAPPVPGTNFSPLETAPGSSSKPALSSFVPPFAARNTSARFHANRMASAEASGTATATAERQPAASDNDSVALQRHGPGKGSVRSIPTVQLSIPEMAETELPMTLTQDALDEADRLIAAGEDHDDDDTIRASAHQNVEAEFDTIDINADADAAADAAAAANTVPDQESWAMLGLGSGETSFPTLPSVSYMENPIAQHAYQPISAVEDTPYYTQASVERSQPQGTERDMDRPTTSGSGGTFEQAQAAFGDFDGVHCDPDAQSDRFFDIALPVAAASEANQPVPIHRPRQQPPPRPTSYLDPETGQQMLYYPARVPAMLQLPAKLSKNPKAAERNKRRSQVLSMMVQNEQQPRNDQRQSRVWLPDPLAGDRGSRLLDLEDPSGMAVQSSRPSSAEVPPAEHGSAKEADLGNAVGPSPNGENMPTEFRRPARLRETDKRKSRMTTLGNVPPQLRASAFFDLPATTPTIEVTNGSATDTLDSILDASANAPVSAFTDHAFAGKLGSEVYGMEKRRSKRNTTMTLSPYGQGAGHAASKSRGSFMSLVGHRRKDSEPAVDADDRRSLMAEDHQRLEANADQDVLAPGLSDGRTSRVIAPAENQDLSNEGRVDGEDAGSQSASDEDDDAYQGPPTTLLAELQLRKQQQKMRTQPIHKAFPNGMHSTLLELDAVAEVERKARKGKRVNLAWEDPSANLEPDDDDDEDVPLGMLYAARVAGHNDIAAVVADMNRPLGLMEKKELEDNEPLSRRRERLQGRDPAVSMYLGNALGGNAAGRQSKLSLTPYLAQPPRSDGRRSSAGAEGNAENNAELNPGGDTVEEVEDEPLAARLRRIKNKEESELPRARPVSMTFSAELLSQFGDPEEDRKKAEKEKKAPASGTAQEEEEETLGQRRRRLQAEREAREHEMASNSQALDALNGTNRLSRRLSLANVLSSHPVDSARGLHDPRETERLRREDKAAQAAREQQKMAVMRAQMSTIGPGPSYGSSNLKPGGYMGGLFNNGRANSMGMGMPGTQRNSVAGMSSWAGASGMINPSGPAGGFGFGQNAVGLGNTYGPLQSQPLPVGMNNGMGMMSNGMGGVGYGYTGFPMPMQQPMPMQVGVQPQGQIDRVERWRQSVRP